MKFIISCLAFLLLTISSSNAGKSKDLKKVDKMYDDGLLTRSECVKAKKKILGSNSSPTCKKTATKKSDNKDFLLKEQLFSLQKVVIF